MTPKGMYSVQKSKSFGGVKQQDRINSAQDAHYGKAAAPPPSEGAEQEQQRTPNLHSLRRRFIRNKRVIMEHQSSEDVMDGMSNGGAGSWKKKNKLGNFFHRLFRKDSKESVSSGGQYEANNNSNRSRRFGAPGGSERHKKPMSLDPIPGVNEPSHSGRINVAKSASLNSLVSVGSAASSFAFVAPTNLACGQYGGGGGQSAKLLPPVSPKNSMACSRETYRARMQQRNRFLDMDRNLTLGTKYNLPPCDDSPTSTIIRQNNFTAAGNLSPSTVPNGPLLSSKSCHGGGYGRDDGHTTDDSDDTMLESVSQRGSPPLSWPRATPAQTAPVRQDWATAKRPIKPRELSGQFIYPLTINKYADSAEDAETAEKLTREQIVNVWSNNFRDVESARTTGSNGNEGGKVNSAEGIGGGGAHSNRGVMGPVASRPSDSSPTNRERGRGLDNSLPSTADPQLSHQLPWRSEHFASSGSNPFGDTSSLAPTALVLSSASADRGDRVNRNSSCSSVNSPRSSLLLAENDGRQLGQHVPGKRRAPQPPSRPLSPAPEGLSSLGHKKSRAPQPPTSREHNSSEMKSSKPASDIIAGAKSSHVRVENSDSRQQCNTAEMVTKKSVDNSAKTDQCTVTGGGNKKSDHQAAPSSAPATPAAGKKIAPSALTDRSSLVSEDQDEEWFLERGVLKSARDSSRSSSRQDLGEDRAPLSPKPWYKRSIARDLAGTGEKKWREKSRDGGAGEGKDKSPDNLPEIHASREKIQIQETFEEKYSYFTRMNKELNPPDSPKSPKQFLRKKILPGGSNSSPKLERPASRPISGLPGISDLDKQAAEIIRKKHEEEAAKRKANDQKFYEEEEEPQAVLDTIMENVSRRMAQFDRKDVNKTRDILLGISKPEDNASNGSQENAKEAPNSPRAGGKKMPFTNKSELPDKVVNNERDVKLDSKAESDLAAKQREAPTARAEGDMLNMNMECMNSLVSDLNSFLADTRRALNSPASQKRPPNKLNEPIQLTATEVDKMCSKEDKSSVDNNRARDKIANDAIASIKENPHVAKKKDKVTKTIASQFSNFKRGDSFFSKQLENMPKSGLPAQPPRQPEPPPLSIEKQDGWSCNRCTLINHNAQIWCEACGGKRLDAPQAAPPSSQQPDRQELAIEEKDLDADSECAPPKIGHVLDKLVLFTSIEAKARETPSVQRRRSGEYGKIGKTYHNASSMMPIDENPLQKTLERITQNQAQLIKSSYNITSNPAPAIQTQAPSAKKSAGAPDEIKMKQNNYSDILRQQEKLLDEARRNLVKQKEHTEKPILTEKTSTLPRSFKESSAVKEVDPPFQTNGTESNYRSAGESNSYEPLRIVEAHENEKLSESVKQSPKSEVKRASSFKGSFDFTKTPSSFLLTRKYISPTAEPTEKNIKVPIAAPKLEFLGANVTRKYSVPDQSQVRQARLEHFQPIPLEPKKDKVKQNEILQKSERPDVDIKKEIKEEKPLLKVNAKERKVSEESQPHAKVSQIATTTIATPPKQASTKEAPQSNPIIPNKKKSAEPYYAKPVSPPRPVTPPRPPAPNFAEVERCPSVRSISSSNSSDNKSERSGRPSIESIANDYLMKKNMKMPANNQVQRTTSTSLAARTSSLPHDRPTTPSRSYTPLLYSSRPTTPASARLSRRNHYFSSPDRDSDSPPFEMCRDYIMTPSRFDPPYDLDRDFRSPSILDDRCLSRMDSMSVMSENNYSAITPEVSRKLSLSVKTEPKFKKDFGFVSSQKESVPKPPRRRRGNESSRPVSRMSSSSSREQTPVNSPKSVKPISLLGQLRATSRNYYDLVGPKSNRTNCDSRVSSRQDDLLASKKAKARRNNRQESDSIYEELVIPSSAFQNTKKAANASSDTDSDFLTPQASPISSRPPSRYFEPKNMHQRSDKPASASYENFNDNPIVDRRLKEATKHLKPSIEPKTSQSSQRPKAIPPRKSIEPIPTPRKSTKRDTSRESSKSTRSVTNPLDKLAQLKTAEPYYKVPNPNPVPVEGKEEELNDHLYAEPIYKQEIVKNAKKTSVQLQSKKSASSNVYISNLSGSSSSKSSSGVKNPGSKEKSDDSRTTSKSDSLHISKPEPKKAGKDKKTSSKRQESKSVKQEKAANNNKAERKASSGGTKLEKQKTDRTDAQLNNRENVEIELSDREEKYYDLTDSEANHVVKKTKGVATLPDGSKYPCVIVQKAIKSDSSNAKPNTKTAAGELTSSESPATAGYTPVQNPLKPDWMDYAKPKKERPKSIVNGVLYTSKSLMEEEKETRESNSLATYNLISPEVFETYDVCRQGRQSSVQDQSKPVSTEMKSLKATNQTPDHAEEKQSTSGKSKLSANKSQNNREEANDIDKKPPDLYPGPTQEEAMMMMMDKGRTVPSVQEAMVNSRLAPETVASLAGSRLNLDKMDLPFTRKTSTDSSSKQNLGEQGEKVRALLVGEGPGGELLSRLEEAITRGDHKYAASLAKELAKLKISNRLTERETEPSSRIRPAEQDAEISGKPDSSLSESTKSDAASEISTGKSGVSRQLSKESAQSGKHERSEQKNGKTIRVEMYVEDAVSAKGPISINIDPRITVADLKAQIEAEFEIPSAVQRWILGKNLVTEDSQILSSAGVEKEGQEVYLYLVSPEKPQTDTNQVKANDEENNGKPKIQANSNQDFVKGRYWNYEEDRWSFCNSDDDAERQDELQTMGDAVTKEEANHQQPEAPGAGEDEWEYYYEDVPADKMKPAATKEAAPTPGWDCPVCTLRNPPERPGCQACTTERPVDYKADGAAAEVAGAAAAAAVAGSSSTAVAKPAANAAKAATTTTLDAYKQLENLDVIPNAEPFECLVCFLDIEPGDGVVLRECLHTFCRLCLAAAIEHSEAPKVKCPYKDDNYSCDMDLLEREIKALVSSAVFEKHQKKSMKEAEANIQGAFHCKTPDCAGWTVIEDNVNTFKCQLCKKTNCITCQAIHDNMDCKQYQQLSLNDETDENSKKTKEWIEGMITKGEALYCMNCQVLLLKKWGCDWVRCTYCRTEICWVTKQLRWGPNGRGDTSGGCKCLADGRTKCHKLCNYCH